MLGVSLVLCCAVVSCVVEYLISGLHHIRDTHTTGDAATTSTTPTSGSVGIEVYAMHTH